VPCCLHAMQYMHHACHWLSDLPLCRALLPLSWPQSVRELIQRCWHSEPYSRPNMPQALQSLAVIAQSLSLGGRA
jgi:hypothetical protein